MPQYKKKKKPGSGPKVALQEINKVLKSILNYICGRSCEGRMRLISRCCHWALGSHFHKYRKEKQSGSSIQQQLICNAAGLSGWGGSSGLLHHGCFSWYYNKSEGFKECCNNKEPLSLSTCLTSNTARGETAAILHCWLERLSGHRSIWPEIHSMTCNFIESRELSEYLI